MFLQGLRGDQNVVDIYKDMRYVSQDFIHEALKILAGVFQPKWASRKEKKAERRNDCRLLDISIVYGDLVISLEEVYLAEEFHTPKVVVEILKIPYWVSIGGRHVVEAPIIAANTPSSARVLLEACARRAAWFSCDEEW